MTSGELLASADEWFGRSVLLAGFVRFEEPSASLLLDDGRVRAALHIHDWEGPRPCEEGFVVVEAIVAPLPPLRRARFDDPPPLELHEVRTLGP